MPERFFLSSTIVNIYITLQYDLFLDVLLTLKQTNCPIFLYPNYNPHEKILTTGLALLGVLALFSCKKEHANENLPAADNERKLLNTLKSHGFSEKDIVDKGTYYLVQGDMAFDKDNTNIDFLNKLWGKKSRISGNRSPVLGPGKTIDQAYLNVIFAGAEVEQLKVYVKTVGTAALDNNWNQAVLTAMEHWSAVTNTRINFIDYGTFAIDNNIDITFQNDQGTLANNVIAETVYPQNGDPSIYIKEWRNGIKRMERFLF